MKRRVPTHLVVIALALLALPAAASAAPTVTLKGAAVPIKGYAHTGNFFGAGAAVHAEYTIHGTEYGGFPDPLIGITASLPRGVKLHPQGFPTCPAALILEQRTPERCPKGSKAGPGGTVDGVVSFGNERVPETAEVSAYFTPGLGIAFFTDGHSPVSLEIPSSGKITNLNGGEGYGPKLVAEVPLVETVPGAPDASVESINVTLGAAYRKNGKPVYYGTVPKTCPRGGFPVRSVLTFAENGEISRPVSVTAYFKAPCPKS